MKSVVCISLFFLSFYSGFSQVEQEASVEKSVFGIQIGLIGAWAHHELKITNQVALRSEVGLAGVNTDVIAPLVGLEPRWYYNLNKRLANGKRIDGNSGNYISLRANYYFYDDADIEQRNEDYFLLAPTWGIRRNLGKHFNYEIGGGVGLGLFNNKDDRKDIGFTTYVNLKFGYRF